MKKYIEDKKISKKEKEDDEKQYKTSDGSKWVKTDSECKFIFSLLGCPNIYIYIYNQDPIDILTRSCSFIADIVLEI
jgi:hypothetical protein